MTVTVTVPAAPAGVVHVIWVGATVTPVAALAPNCTVAPVRKPVPVSVTVAPPASGPPASAIAEIVGAGL